MAFQDQIHTSPQPPKVLLSRLGLFLVPIGLCLALLEWYLIGVPNLYKAKDTIAQVYGPDAQVVVLGSSHTLKGLNPDYFDQETLNLANVSQTLPVDYELLKHYSNQFKAGTWIVVPISYFSLFEDLKTADPARLYCYARFNDTRYPDLPYMDFKQVSLTALYGTRMAIRMVFDQSANEALGLNTKGFQSTDPVEHILPSDAGHRLSEHHRTMSEQNLELNKTALDSLQQFCQTKRYNLLLVTMPVHHLYWLGQQKRYNHITDSTVKQLSMRHAIPYLNLDQYPELPDSAFSDPDHLSRIGAKLISPIVSQTIKGLAARRARQE